MIPIHLNTKIFDLHIQEITNEIELKCKDLLKIAKKKDTIACINYLLEKKQIENIIKADVSELKDFIIQFKKDFPNSLGKDEYKKLKINSPRIPEIYRFLRYKIFENIYTNWIKRTKKYNAYQFVNEIGLKTCPYCNRTYTFIVDEADSKLRPEIDHFFPKSIYPFLAMSFFNLIPSCSICNHTKTDKDSFTEDLINPYDIKGNEFKFTYIPTNIDFYQVKREKFDFDNFEIEFEKSSKNISFFKLKELYQQHKDIVLELILKKEYYPASYIKELKNYGFSENEIYRFILSNFSEKEDFHKRPLSKLTYDIADELGIIKKIR